MKSNVKYCDDTIRETGALINSTEASSKERIEKEEYRNTEKSFFKMKKLQNAL